MSNSLTLFPMGGWNPPPQTDFANYAYFCLENMFFLVFDFYYNGYRELMAKFFGDGPPKNLKISNFSKVTQHDLL